MKNIEDDDAGAQSIGQPFRVPDLPFAPAALEPYISSRTLSFHHDKHHQAYVDNLNKLTSGTDLAELSIEDLIRHTSDLDDPRSVFNNAAQAWNHEFYWQSLVGRKTRPSGQLMRMVNRDFGSFDAVCSEIHAKALAHFGSGWVWLVLDGDRLRVTTTSNAGNPLSLGQTPLLVIDVWEHAYYLDHQNRRGQYLEGVISSLLNWDHATAVLARA